MKLLHELNKPFYSAILSAIIVITTLRADVDNLKKDVELLKKKMIAHTEILWHIQGANAQSLNQTQTKKEK